MMDKNTQAVNHLRVSFNLKALVADAFVQDLPHKKLNGLRMLLDTFGAKVTSNGKTAHTLEPEGSPLRMLGDEVRKILGENPAMARKLNGEITVELEDDRNVKAFVASLELGPYDDVINKQSIKIDTHSYNETELSQGDSGIVRPPYPPAKARYIME